jgi:GPH family glycoside/pentoside/hexuronide:cation symporter
VALFLLTIFIFVNLSMRGAITLYYFRYYLGREELFGLFNAVGLSVAVGGILLSKPLSMRFGKRNTFVVCLLLTALFLFLFVFVPPDAIWAIFLLQVLLQLSYGPTIPLLWAMMADVADYSEWKTGRRATGMTFSAASFGSKAGLGLGGAASGWLLAQYGYVPNVEQTDSTLQGILWMMSVYPAAAFLIGVVILAFYGIDKQLNLRIQDELAERRRHYGEDLETAT